MWTQESIDAGVEAARSVVRGDGADLVLVKADEKRGSIDLRLDVTNLHCEDGTCLLPGRMLEGMIIAKLQEHLEGEFELTLHDPRQDA
jgi:hypothetical protein